MCVYIYIYIYVYIYTHICYIYIYIYTEITLRHTAIVSPQCIASYRTILCHIIIPDHTLSHNIASHLFVALFVCLVLVFVVSLLLCSGMCLLCIIDLAYVFYIASHHISFYHSIPRKGLTVKNSYQPSGPGDVKTWLE